MQKEIMVGVLRLLLALICVGVIIVAQRTVSLESLGVMLLALVGLIAIVWHYNRKYMR